MLTSGEQECFDVAFNNIGEHHQVSFLFPTKCGNI